MWLFIRLWSISYQHRECTILKKMFSKIRKIRKKPYFVVMHAVRRDAAVIRHYYYGSSSYCGRFLVRVIQIGKLFQINNDSSGTHRVSFTSVWDRIFFLCLFIHLSSQASRLRWLCRLRSFCLHRATWIDRAAANRHTFRDRADSLLWKSLEQPILYILFALFEKWNVFFHYYRSIFYECWIFLCIFSYEWILIKIQRLCQIVLKYQFCDQLQQPIEQM